MLHHFFEPNYLKLKQNNILFHAKQGQELNKSQWDLFKLLSNTSIYIDIALHID